MGRTDVLALLAGSSPGRLARGEIWVAPAVLESQGLPNNAAGVAGLAARLGADLCFLSCHGPQAVPFRPTDLREAVALVHAQDLACGVVVDGPWQRLSQREGVLSLLPTLRSSTRIPQELAAQAELAQAEYHAWIAAGADLVLLADDLAFGEGPYFAPALFARLLLPHYRQFLLNAARHRVPLGFHSDGDLFLLLPALIEAGFSFFSLEPEATDLVEFRRRFGSQAILLSGIRAAWLSGASGKSLADPANSPSVVLSRSEASPRPGPAAPGRCFAAAQHDNGRASQPALNVRNNLADLVLAGNVILASACGLFDPAALVALKEVYRLADRLI